VIDVVRGPGDQVGPGQPVLVLEAMKMEHEIVAQDGGLVTTVAVQLGQTVQEGELLATLEPGQQAPPPDEHPEAPETRQDLQAVIDRHALTQDEARPEAIQKRHEKGRRTARENLNDLIDDGSLVEYGPLMFAAQERRRDRDELIRRTPADGLVAGSARVDGQEAVVMSYDYTVLAGTQGMRNHTKKDRLFELAERRRLPVVLFAEGGGGRPGDVDWPHVAGLDCRAFHLFAQLSGLVPLVGIASGYCFAGNAALLGCCDVVIASEDASIGPMTPRRSGPPGAT
jgi:acetyl-CoA carboxylase carboxyltransferase component